MFCAYHDEMHQAIIIAVPECKDIGKEKKAFRLLSEDSSCRTTDNEALSYDPGTDCMKGG